MHVPWVLLGRAVCHSMHVPWVLLGRAVCHSMHAQWMLLGRAACHSTPSEGTCVWIAAYHRSASRRGRPDRGAHSTCALGGTGGGCQCPPAAEGSCSLEHSNDFQRLALLQLDPGPAGYPSCPLLPNKPTRPAGQSAFPATCSATAWPGFGMGLGPRNPRMMPKLQLLVDVSSAGGGNVGLRTLPTALRARSTVFVRFLSRAPHMHAA
jgi:hypothetical protein